ncbi:MAG: ABC transporter substrate-binding protein [Candidatus Heimdallarchaeota archaeon]|nr:ABC transporter substrate-binding protein [Candidatus Heimdallarchaeota archaeon]
MKRKYLNLLIMFSMIFSLGSSMLPNVTALTSNAETDVVIFAMPYDFDEYSAYTANSYATAQWNAAVYAGLLKRSSAADRDYVADLAVSMPTQSSDGLTYTFTLKDDLKFSNGHKLTTSDVELSWKAALTPAVNTNFYGIYVGFFDNASIVVKDSKTVEFTMLTSYAFPFGLLSFPIIDEEVFGDRYDRCLEGVAEDCIWNNPDGSDAISAGPYMVSDVDNVHEIVTVAANPFYYGANDMFTDKIIFQKIADKDAAISALASGLIDILDSQYIPGLNELADLDGVTEDFIGDPAHQEISLNHLNPYFGTGESIPGNTAEDLADALLVRKAMTHVVDRKFAVDEIMEGLALPASTPMPAASLGWDATLIPRNFSVTTAMGYMEDAGFDYADAGTQDTSGVWSNPFFTVTVMSPNTNPARNQWSANYVLELPKIGIGVKEHVSTGWGEIAPRTFNYAGGTLVPAYADGGFDVFFVGYSWDLDWNPSGLYTGSGRCDTGDCGNFYNFDVDEDQTEVGALTTAYLTELDFDARLLKAKDLQAEFYKVIPVLPILYAQSHWGFNDDIDGIDSLLISVAAQEWELVKLTGFTKNVVDTKTLDVNTDDDAPVSTFAVVSALFFVSIIAVYRRRAN